MNFFQWVTLTAHLVSPATIIVIVIILVNAPLHTQNTWKVLYCACLCLCVRGPVQQNTDREREIGRRDNGDESARGIVKPGGRSVGEEGEATQQSKAIIQIPKRHLGSAVPPPAACCWCLFCCKCACVWRWRSFVRARCPLFLTRCAFSLIRTFLPSGRVTAERKRPRAFFLLISCFIHCC